MITLKHLIIFREVARVKSMSKAAENLYISQPTVSRKIQEIEDYYHIKLFQRFSKTLGISEEGILFLEHVNYILNEMDKIDDLFFNKKDTISLRLGSTLTVANTLTPMLLADVKEKQPLLNFSVFIDNTQSIENMLLENKLDLGLVEGDIHNDMIIHEPIIHDQLALVCSNNHELAIYDTITINDLSHQTYIMREKGSGTRSMFEQFMQSHKIPYQISWECHSWDSIKQAVVFNHGITLISLRLVEKEIDEGSLHVLKIDNCSWTRMFSLCYHKNKIWNDNFELVKQTCLSYVHCPIMELLKVKGRI